MLKVDYSARQAKLREIAGFDAVALVPGFNMYYFTGLEFHLSERPVIAILTPDGELSFIIPELEGSMRKTRLFPAAPPQESAAQLVFVV